MGTDIELAVLFSDVVGSTRIYEVLGDQRAREIVALCIDLMTAGAAPFGATLFNTFPPVSYTAHERPLASSRYDRFPRTV